MSARFLKRLAGTKALAGITPGWVKDLMRSHFIIQGYDREIWAQSDPFRNSEPHSDYESDCPFRLGIIREFAHEHQHYIAACREMKIRYRLVDISGSNWIEEVGRSGCDAFLVWPSAYLTIWKQLYDERLRILTDDLGITIYPSYKELWIYESKRRMRDWLAAHAVPHPATEVFYDEDQAMDFLDSAELPIVMKTDLGAGSNGISILKSRAEARKMVLRAFRRGITVKRGDRRDRQWGSVILQEYLPVVREWRMVRIGDSYFGHPKGKEGDFHSGSGKVLWDRPQESLLDFLREVTLAGGFTSMDVDVFETADGRYLVNELQTVFGASFSKDQLRIDGRPGRFCHRNDGWIFEEGDFARNACANLRVEHLLKILRNSNRNGACTTQL